MRWQTDLLKLEVALLESAVLLGDVVLVVAVVPVPLGRGRGLLLWLLGGRRGLRWRGRGHGGRAESKMLAEEPKEEGD